MKVKISALLVVFKEEKIIEDCIKNIYSIVDEIILVHDGPPVDKTVDIAKKFKKVKCFYNKVNMGAPEFHWPFAASRATGEWLLIIDADERLSPNLREEVVNVVKNDGVISKKKYDLFRANWVKFREKSVKGTNSYKNILLRRNEASMIGIVHFGWETNGKHRGVLKSEFIHKHPKKDFTFYLRRNKKLTNLQAKGYVLYKNNRNKIPVFNFKSQSFPKHTLRRIQFPLILMFPMMIIALFVKFKKFYKLSLIDQFKKYFLTIHYQYWLSINIFRAKLNKKKIRQDFVISYKRVN